MKLKGYELFGADLSDWLDLDEIRRGEVKTAMRESTPLFAKDFRKKRGDILLSEQFRPISLPASTLGMSGREKRRGGLPDARASKKRRMLNVRNVAETDEEKREFALAEAERSDRVDSANFVDAKTAHGIDGDVVEPAVSVLIRGQIIGVRVVVAEWFA